MDSIKPQPNKPIALSNYTKALIESLSAVRPKQRPDDLSKFNVSQTVSFIAFLYEKVRNAVEFREDHQVRRSAIERILKRRLAINLSGNSEAENLIRELLWARYFDTDSLGTNDIDAVQKLIDKYVFLRNLLVVGRTIEHRDYLNEFLLALLTSEIEEMLNPQGSKIKSSLTYFIFQVVKKKIKIEGVSDEIKDAYFFAALEKTFRRSDRSYQRFHLFTTFYKPLSSFEIQELQSLLPKLPSIFAKIDEMIKNPLVDTITRFTKKQLPPFLILFSLMKDKSGQIMSLVTDRNKLWSEVELTCRVKYQEIGHRLRNLAIKSFIYIFTTKMFFALILEYPLSKYIYGEINYESIVINTLFPPFLMLTIISFFHTPGPDNTFKIYNRIIEIIDADTSFETQVALIKKKPRERRPVLVFGFTIFYSITFIVTLFLIYRGLLFLNFNTISVVIFIFFVSLISFFSYRIKHIVNEYKLSEKESILSPIVDFFFMPVLSLGKFFSQEIAKLNFFIFIFDFIIEAPFKFVFEIVEEWISFVRKRKEEII